jgi:hypothetical protein
MVHRSLSFKQTLITIITAGLIFMTGCSTKSKNRSPDWSRNTDAVQRTAVMDLMTPGGAVEERALQRFIDFYRDYSTEAIKAGVREIYADDAWFGDPFHIVQGIEDIEHYFLVMAEPVEKCTFTVDSIQRSENDYFARWTMELESGAAKGEVIKTIGMSHVRFNTGGKVIFQQDYWDTGALLDRLPVVGFWTRQVKDRINEGLEK